TSVLRLWLSPSLVILVLDSFFSCSRHPRDLHSFPTRRSSDLSRISPRTSTVILRDKSPFATAVVTSAMLRTCVVRFAAIELTESVRSFHVPATPRTSACPPSLPSVPTSRGVAGTWKDLTDRSE